MRGRSHVTFLDRRDAGATLAGAVDPVVGTAPAVVLGLPRGGVVVAAPVARRLQAPLGVVVVRKIRTPGHAEVAMGALALWGDRIAVIRNNDVVDRAGVDAADFEAAVVSELAVARERVNAWAASPIDVADRVAVLVDDGLATGATMSAAAQVLREAGAARSVAAVPVGAPEPVAELARHVDEIVCLHEPARFGAVSAYYEDFAQVDDATVTAELADARHRLRH